MFTLQYPSKRNCGSVSPPFTLISSRRWCGPLFAVVFGCVFVVSTSLPTVQELLQLEGCAAFVVKVSVVGGLSRSARLCGLARRLGAEAVLSSAFETGVGLAHASILASCFTNPGE